MEVKQMEEELTDGRKEPGLLSGLAGLKLLADALWDWNNQNGILVGKISFRLEIGEGIP